MNHAMQRIVFSLVLGALGASASAADIARGAALAKTHNCASCHGADFNKPIDPSYPKLAGRVNPIMAALVQPLSNRDMADLGAYLGSLPGQLVTKK
jgi:cytochrome c553